jgi:hypothetical protein
MSLAVHADNVYGVSMRTGRFDPALLGELSVSHRKSDSGSDIRKRTPLEQAIAEQTDRRARYEAKRQRDGFKRTTVYVREDQLEVVKAFIRKANEAAPGGPVQ